MKDFKYFKPSTLKEASELLLEFGTSSYILNGGTDLIVRLRERMINPQAVIDIKGIEELYNIAYTDKVGLVVGACVNLNDMAHNPIIKEKYKVLSDAARSVGSGQVRNRATMAGNICNASPLADTSTPLLVLDATVLVYGPHGDREISIHDFFTGVRKTSLKNGEIVRGIMIPAYKNIKGVFQKLSRRKEVDLSTVCASVVEVNDDIRIALGSVAPTPIRARKAEQFLKNRDISEANMNLAGELASTDATPISDVRASMEYRIEMTKVLVRRGLEEIKKI